MTKRAHYFLLAEALLLFGGVPVLLIGQPRAVKLAAIWFFAAFAAVMLRRIGVKHAAHEWNWPGAKAGLKNILPRFLVFASVLTLLLLLIAPERLLSFPLERPALWLMVMFWYPVLSALPQEFVYRSLFHYRYARLCKGQLSQLVMSGAAFGWMHVIFLNPVAIILTALGGFMFSHTYLQHRSLALAWIEHALYGCFIFTIGFGWYFYGVSYSR